jgi:hypothetical protein
MSKGDRSFAAKVRKQSRTIDKRHVMVIKSIKDPKTGAVRFADRVVAVPTEANMDDVLKQAVEEEE